MMKHKANSMKMSTSKSNVIWYVDSGTSNHMKNHEEWLSYLKKPEQPRIVETGDDTPHPIERIRNIFQTCRPKRDDEESHARPDDL